MGNLSYCRFENTASALQDCIDAVEEMIELAETYSNYAQGIQEQVDDAWTEEQESFK